MIENSGCGICADNYVSTLSREQSKKYSFEAVNKDDTNEWQVEFRRELIKILGIDKIKERGISSLNATCLDVNKQKDHIREEWKIDSESGYQVPLYVLRPFSQEKPLPLVITPHGHNENKDIYAGIFHNEYDQKRILEGSRDIALQAVRQGYIAIALDQRGFAGTRYKKDIEENKANSCRTMNMHALLFGRCLIGERVWDITRIIDYTMTRPEIDSKNIVITGNSSGGTISLFSAAIDNRITVCIPSCYFCTFQHSIGSIHHCECNYVPGIMSLGEMYDVAGLIAPRPFLAVAGRQDNLFPIQFVKDSYQKLLNIYKYAGYLERCELYIGDGGHQFYKEPVWDFVKKWCKSN